MIEIRVLSNSSWAKGTAKKINNSEGPSTVKEAKDSKQYGQDQKPHIQKEIW